MNARNNVKKPSNQSWDARLAAAQLRFAARVDFLVARWLERCATNAQAAQRLFKTDRKPTREFGMGVSRRRGGDSIKVSREAARVAASVTLVQTTADHQC